MDSYRLEMKGICKSFPGVQALDNAMLAVKPGEVQALLGINGAGKSTMIKVLSGVYTKDSGDIYLDGQHIDINSPLDAINCGIATVYQDPEMISSFSGIENIFLGREHGGEEGFGVLNRKSMYERAMKILEKVPVEIDLEKKIEDMSQVEKEIVAILRALSQESTVLVLDEPTSILTQTEKKILFDLVRVLKNQGTSILFITHRLEEVFEIADRLTVFRDGKNVATQNVSESAGNQMKIAELMLGKELKNLYPEKDSSKGEEILEIRNLSLDSAFKNISFKARKGEILGIFGLVGSGLEELANSLFGIYPDVEGEIFIKGKKTSIKKPSKMIKKGVFLIPADRRKEGLISDEPIFFNTSISGLNKVSGIFDLVRKRKESEKVTGLVTKLDLRPGNIETLVSNLSGGNQQKVVFCKGLFTDSQIYIIAEPTVGVDVGAKYEIYKLIRELSKDNAVVVLSSDCEEIYGVCDKALCLFEGENVLETDIEDISLERMLLYGVTGVQN